MVSCKSYELIEFINAFLIIFVTSRFLSHVNNVVFHNHVLYFRCNFLADQADFFKGNKGAVLTFAIDDFTYFINVLR